MGFPWDGLRPFQISESNSSLENNSNRPIFPSLDLFHLPRPFLQFQLPVMLYLYVAYRGAKLLGVFFGFFLLISESNGLK